ncbi:hypothetical protein ACLOJK_022348 [Asimina triloba]
MTKAECVGDHQKLLAAEEQKKLQDHLVVLEKTSSDLNVAQSLAIAVEKKAHKLNAKPESVGSSSSALPVGLSVEALGVILWE